MDPRPDTSSSSGRFRGQWSFLSNTPHHAQPYSLPPSSYLPHSDRSSASPHLYNGTNASRSSIPRNLATVSIGGRSSATTPSQPVLIRVHSADASAHLNPAPRPRRPINMSKNHGLPALSEFSIQGILAAIQEDVESDINTISEILGRSRLVLADQHDSHMPPQGEIIAMPNTLQAVEEASSDSERLANDDVFILREDASLCGGSQMGSAAYDLLERLQAIPRQARIPSDTPEPRTSNASFTPSLLTSPERNIISPTAAIPAEAQMTPGSPRDSRNLLRTSPQSHTTRPWAATAIVSEHHLSASTNGAMSQDGSLSFTTSHYPPIDDYDTEEEPISDPMEASRSMALRLAAWLQGHAPGQSDTNQTAESHLRELLER